MSERRIWPMLLVDLLIALFGALLTEGASRAWLFGREGGFSALSGMTMFGIALAFSSTAVLILAPLRALLRRGVAARLLAASLVFVGTAALLVRPARIASSGAWARQQTWSPYLARGLPLVGALLATLLVCMFLGRAPQTWALRQGRRALVLFGFGASVWANVALFPGQYRELHLGLMVLAALCSVWMFEDARTPLYARLNAAQAASRLMLALLFAGATGVLMMAVRPPDEVVSALLLGSQRAGYVLPYVARARRSDAIYQRLLRFEARPKLPTKISNHQIPKAKPYTNVLLVVVDTLRADTLPPTRDQYHNVNFKPSDTPFLSKLVSRSYRFTRAYGAGTMTRISMPSLFRSREAFEDNTYGGEPIAVAMNGIGLYPVAVVGQHFIEPTDERMAGLLEGFAEIEVYPESHQEQQNVLTRKLLERTKDRPFFAWLHYYAPHYKGFAGAPLEAPANDWPQNYPKTVRWLDGQIRELFAMLASLGLAESTVVVFTSDHGEGLMDTGQLWHGDSVLEEAVRVPLFLFFPDRPGGLIDQTVGNIDIVPTLVEFLGGPTKSSWRGRSLLPLVGDSRAAWDRSYYIEAESDQRSALVRGTQKQIFDHGTRLHMHFDLAKDPREDHNLFDATKEAHRKLLLEVVERRPGLFKDGLDDAATERLFDQKLAEVNPADPPKDVGFLVDLIRLKPNEARLGWALKLFERAPSPAVRALLIERLYESDPKRFGALMSSHFERARNAGTLNDFLAALADVDLPNSAATALSDKLKDAVDAPRDTLRPWLSIVSRMSLSRELDVRTLRVWLERLISEPSPTDAVSLRLALTAVLRLSRVPVSEKGALVALALRLLDDPRANVEAAACRALGRLEDPRAVPALRTRLDGRPFVVRLGAMHGLAALIKTEIEPDLLRIGREPGYTLNAVVLLEKYGTTRASSFLTWVSENGERPFTRHRAMTAKKRIRERATVMNLNGKP